MKKDISELKPNKLACELSPYLLQHAYNPVEWYPWGEEAFEKSRKEDKPIFLSIGYSTCHWCHVMEKESFEDQEMANLINEVFIPIKVDREERPDLDAIYMEVCQMMTGSGGWPLTVFLTSEKKPFFAGTYFPKDSKYGRIGLRELIGRVQSMWKDQRQELINSANGITRDLQAQLQAPQEETTIDKKIFQNAHYILDHSFDEEYGGFGQSPKFPTAHNLSFLLRHWFRTKDDSARIMVAKTLDEMSNGGMYDHLGFGFHRYSTDKKWLVPHFEKMLYDQAMLLTAYTEAFQATGNERYKETAEEIIEYVRRDMTAPEGGFYSAEDADSDGEEGKYYVWRQEEIKKLLPDFEEFCRLYNLTEVGNFQDELSGKSTGRNIPHLNLGSDHLSQMDIKLINKITEQKRILLKRRANRIKPLKDDKVLTDWNGLMIAALAKAGLVFQNGEYTKLAQNAAQFIFDNLSNSDGSLKHRWRNGESGLQANIDDYAFFCRGLIELYFSTFDTRYLKEAIRLTDLQIEKFNDNKNGGFFFTPNDGEELIIRKKDIYDGAIPSGNSMSLLNLRVLYSITSNKKYSDVSDKLISFFSANVTHSPQSFTQFLSGLDLVLNPNREIIVVGRKSDTEIKKILEYLNLSFIPDTIVILIDIDNREEIDSISEYYKSYTSQDGRTTVYLCENFQCKAPVNSLDELIKLM